MLRSCASRHERQASHARRGNPLHALSTFPFVVLFCIIISLQAPATGRAGRLGDGIETIEVVLAVTNLNFDCYPDTVIGWADEQFHYLPHSIHWGQPPAGADSACASGTPAARPERITMLAYPNEKRLTGSVSFERLNGDTLTDLVFYLWWERPRKGTPNGNGNEADNGNGTKKRDSLRSLVIFGQLSLDAVKEVNLNAIGAFQWEPYCAMELTPGVDFRNPRERDLSGVPSYEVRPVVLDVESKGDTAEHQPSAPSLAGVASGNTAASIEMRAYPNPSAGITRIEAHAVPPGIYTIELVALNGMVAIQEEVMVDATRQFASELDVRQLPTGYYVVRLRGGSGSAWNAAYPIIISR